MVPSEQGHKGVGERVEALIECFKRSLTTDRIPQQHGNKVENLVMPETATRKPHPLTDDVKHALAGKMVGDHGHFLEYVILPPFLIV